MLEYSDRFVWHPKPRNVIIQIRQQQQQTKRPTIPFATSKSNEFFTNYLDNGGGRHES